MKVFMRKRERERESISVRECECQSRQCDIWKHDNLHAPQFKRVAKKWPRYRNKIYKEMSKLHFLKKAKKESHRKVFKKFPNGAKWAKKRNNEFSATWHLSNFCQLDVSTEKNILQLLVKFLKCKKSLTVFIVSFCDNTSTQAINTKYAGWKHQFTTIANFSCFHEFLFKDQSVIYQML